MTDVSTTEPAEPGPLLRRPGWRLLPGLALAAAVTVLAMAVGRLSTLLSPLLVALVVGVVLANVRPPGPALQPGLTFASKRVLRIGVALLGLQLVLAEVVALGWPTLLLVVVVVAVGATTTAALGARMGLTTSQSLLIACGCSICGAAAVAAVDGVVDAEEDEVAAAIGLVALFGTVMIAVLPLAAGLMSLSPQRSGIWIGASTHEVAQVVAAGGIVGGAALGAAVAVKLARVLLLAPTMAIISWRLRNRTDAQGARPPLVPFFVLAFLALVAVRATGLVPPGAVQVAALVQTALLTAAMFGLGSGVRLGRLLAVGGRPVLLAAFATTVVGGLGLAGALLV